MQLFLCFYCIEIAKTRISLYNSVTNSTIGDDVLKIGERIKHRRVELGMTAEKLGEVLGKNRATIYRYENGDIEKLPLDILEPIAEALQTTPQYLMGWDEVQEKNDFLAEVVVRLRTDKAFFDAVSSLYKLDANKLESLIALLK